MGLYKLIIPFLALGLNLEAGWLEKKAEGWAWYEDTQKIPEEDGEAIEQEQPFISASEILADERKNLENLLAEAMLKPTLENTKKYMEAQRKWIQQATGFANSWQKVIIANPQLDPTATTFSTSQYGRQLQQMIEQEEKEIMIKEVSKEYGLFFFYEGNSKISKAFALVVNAFVKKYGWSVLGISTDGILLEEITNSTLDNGMTNEIGITIFPALFAVNPRHKEAIPLAFGLRTMDQIEDNIFAQFNNNMEEP
jgi:conjugal transfer pilus assembly protein TraF